MGAMAQGMARLYRRTGPVYPSDEQVRNRNRILDPQGTNACMTLLPAKHPFSRLVLLVLITAAHISIAATAVHAQDTLRVGRAIANSWSFVPLDVGMAARIFAQHNLAIESVSFTRNPPL